MSDTHYLKYRNLIYKCAWQRVRQNPNLDFDEMVCWGNLAYTEALQTWKAEMGCFSTHLYWQMKFRHSKANEAKIDDGQFTTAIDDAFGLSDNDDPFGACSFKSALDCLSDEAKEVVNLILGSAGELCDFTAKTVKVTRTNVKNYLRSLKWPGAKIDKAIKEIKNALKTL